LSLWFVGAYLPLFSGVGVKEGKNVLSMANVRNKQFFMLGSWRYDPAL
jgi:hypothetical protein